MKTILRKKNQEVKEVKSGNQEIKPEMVWSDKEKCFVKQDVKLLKLYKTMYKKISNNYDGIEKIHGQFEFDKLDLLNEAFCVLQNNNRLHNNEEFKVEKQENLTLKAWKIFHNLKKAYYRKFVKPVNSDRVFVEFNSDKLKIFDETNCDQNYFDSEYLNRIMYIKTIIRGLKSHTDKKMFAMFHCREIKQINLAKRLNLTQQNCSLRIKKLNNRIMLICKKNKIDSVIDTRFCMPSWKQEKIAMTQSYWTAPSAPLASVRKLDSQKGTGKKWQWDKKTKKLVPVCKDVYEYQKTNSYKRNIGYYEHSRPSEFTKKRNVKQEGFFGNCGNGPRLLDLLNSNNLIYGSDSFNAFYSKRSIF